MYHASRRPGTSRSTCAIAGSVAVAVGIGGALLFGGAGPAAASAPRAQSVGRFLDGAAGGKPIQQLVDLKDARAMSPGTTSAQNPLDATLLGKVDVPLTGKLQLPGGGAFTLGAANQVAKAKSDGYSYGAAGAVANSGGASLGGNNNAFPANATIKLSDKSLGSVPIPGLPKLPGLPGLPGLPAVPGSSSSALGGVTASIGAVSALAQTKTGGTVVRPRYQIAGLTLSLGSPALGALLGQLASGGTAVTALIAQIQGALGSLPGAPAGLPGAKTQCALTSGSVPSKITLDHGAVVIDAAKATITIDVAALLRTLHADLNGLPANTDLLGYLLGNLGTILSTGLESVVSGITAPLQKAGTDCLSALPKPVADALGSALTQLAGGQNQLETAINGIAKQLSSASKSGVSQLVSGLGQAASIGVNVQSGPGKGPNNTQFPFRTKLAATPDQATPVVAHQTLVRAIEIDLGGGQAALALANAAVGPAGSAVEAAPPTTAAPTPEGTPNTQIPTGVPAGAGTPGDSPELPLTLLSLALLMAGVGAVAWRVRLGRHGG